MTTADDLFERITQRARIAAGEERPARTQSDRDAASPYAALHAGAQRTGVDCDSEYVDTSTCPEDAVVRITVGRSGSSIAACPRCLGRARYRAQVTHDLRIVERL